MAKSGHYIYMVQTKEKKAPQGVAEGAALRPAISQDASPDRRVRDAENSWTLVLFCNSESDGSRFWKPGYLLPSRRRFSYGGFGVQADLENLGTRLRWRFGAASGATW